MTTNREQRKAMQELNNAKKEAAATAAIQTRYRNPGLLEAIFQVLIKLLNWKLLLVILLAVVVSFGGYFILSNSSFKQESTVFVETVNELSSLATAEAHLKVIIKEQDNTLFGKEISANLPGTKREFLIIAPATVIAGVDLKSINSEDIILDEENKELKLAIPRATFIQDPAIKMDQVIAISDEGLLSGSADMDKGFELAAKAQEKAKEEAVASGLLTTAEKNAEKALKEFFGHMGYKVIIEYK